MLLLITETAAYDEAALSRLLNALPPLRKEKAEQAKHRGARTSCILGYALISHAARLLLPDAELGDFLFGDRGKPHLPDPRLSFSLSHTAQGVAVAATTANIQIGLDLESVRPLRSSLLHDFTSEAEYAAIVGADDPEGQAIALWTQKEAEAKRTGYGIGQDLRSIRLQSNATTELSLGGVRHMLTLTPCTELPPIRYVMPSDLL